MDWKDEMLDVAERRLAELERETELAEHQLTLRERDIASLKGFIRYIGSLKAYDEVPPDALAPEKRIAVPDWADVPLLQLIVEKFENATVPVKTADIVSILKTRNGRASYQELADMAQLYLKYLKDCGIIKRVSKGYHEFSARLTASEMAKTMTKTTGDISELF